MIKLLRKLLTNPGHDQYMCERRHCKICELLDTGYPSLLAGSQDGEDLNGKPSDLG